MRDRDPSAPEPSRPRPERLAAPIYSATWLDRTVAYFLPERGLRRAKARAMFQTMARSFEGAKTGRRVDSWITATSSANQEIGPALARLRGRSRDLVRNNAYAKRAVESIVSNVIGEGITPRARTGDRARDQEIDSLWRTSSEEIDADGQLDFAGLQALVVRSMAESGETLIRYRPRRVADGYAVPLQMQVLEADHLDTAKTVALKNGGVILQGVEFDARGRRVAYWLFPVHPGELALSTAGRFQSKRVAARFVEHIYTKQRPGQVRGYPWLASVILRLRDLDEYQDAELLRKKVAACFAAFITRPEGVEGPSVGVGSGTVDEERRDMLEPGIMEYLKQGEGIEFPTPPVSGDYANYVTAELQAAAAGAGTTYEQLSSDLSRVNFASHRAGLIEFRRMMRALQYHIVIPRVCRATWSRWSAQALATGALSDGSFAANWTPRPFESADPLKDAMTDTILTRGGAMTIPQLIQKYAHDPEEQLQELIEWAIKLDAANLVLDTDPRKVAKTGAMQAIEAPKPIGDDAEGANGES